MLVLMRILLVINLMWFVQPDRPLNIEQLTIKQVSSLAPEITPCSGQQVKNNSNTTVYLVVTRLIDGSSEACMFDYRELKPGETSPTQMDVEAIWLTCGRNAFIEGIGCLDGMRPFKFGTCAPGASCPAINGQDNNLYLTGTSACSPKPAHLDWKCGWVSSANDGWDPAWNDHRPIPDKVTYTLNTSWWNCIGACLTNPPPVPKNSVDGYVRSEKDNSPIDNAEVTLSNGENLKTIPTNGDGYYRFINVPVGRFSISVYKEGYNPVITGVQVDDYPLNPSPVIPAPTILLEPNGVSPSPTALPPPPQTQPCGAPGTVSPGDGETIRNRQVTLRWSAPNCSGLDGYTLHITTSTGPEDGIIFDQGVGPTEYSFTFPKDGTFYWHVAAWSNGQRGPWSSRRVVIDTTQVQPPAPDCDPGTDGIVLYEHANFQGRCRNFRGDEPNFGNVSGWLNDQASSLEFRGYYAGRYEVMLYKSADYNDGRGPFRDNIANLSSYDINDQASSLTVRPLPCYPNSDQISLHYERNYGGACVILDIGNYPDPGQLAPVGNDSAWSIRVGNNVQATLYSNANFDGTVVTFTSDNPDLGFTPINGGTSSVKVETRRTPPPTPTPSSPPVVSRCDVPTGQFCAEYYNNRILEGGPIFRQNEPNVDHQWGSGGPGNGIGVDNFSVRWTGRFSFDDAEYDFTTAADDGIRIFIDDQPIIDGWRDQSLTGYSKRQRLSGEHVVRVEYYENGGDAAVGFGWTKATGTSSAQRCSPPSGKFCTEYYANRMLTGDPSFVREESTINHDWGDGGPENGVGSDNFSVRWVGSFTFDNGQYSFRAVADDGVRVWVDNDLVIDGWLDQPPTEYQGVRTLSGEHIIKVEYYENGGGANIHLEWSRSASTPPASWNPNQWQNVSDLAAVTDVVHSGSRAVRISSDTNNDARWIQSIPVKPNTNYKLTGWVKTANVSHTSEAVDAGANLCLYDTWTRSSPVFGTSDWSLVTLEFNSGDSSQVTVGARLGYWSGTTTGTAWFDDLELREQTLQGQGSNLIQNGGFEQ